MLFMDTNKEACIDPARTSLIHTSYGDGVTMIIHPQATLYAAVVASVDVNLAWKVIPLAGRRVLGEPRDA
jgi:hypothetical protein